MLDYYDCSGIKKKIPIKAVLVVLIFSYRLTDNKLRQVVFTCILEIISTMLYIIYVGEFSNIIQYQSFRFFSYYTKHVELMVSAIS